jgi:hypothetical protein
VSRKRLDLILSITGLVMAVVLAVAGALLLWGGNFAKSTVHDQLVAQKISFGAASSLPESLQGYANQQVTNGTQAKAYSDLIAEHLTKVAGGKTYSEVSSAYLAGGSKDAALAGQRTTLFMGETLRGLLLNAYAFSIFGQIATIAAWVAFAAAAVLLVLGILGLVHQTKTPPDAVVLAPEREMVNA